MSCYFSLISLKKYQVSSLNESGDKAVVLRSESSDTEIKDAFEGKCLQSRYAVKWVLNTDSGFKAASWTLPKKKCTAGITSKFDSNV